MGGGRHWRPPIFFTPKIRIGRAIPQRCAWVAEREQAFENWMTCPFTQDYA